MHEYKGLHIHQRIGGNPKADVSLFVIADTADRILSWAQVERTFETPGTAQRMLSETHLNRIQSFMNADYRNVIPTSATIALEAEEYVLAEGDGVRDGVSYATLTISDEASGAIIDGQHRLHAMKGVEANLLVTILLGADKLERALQFVVINNSAKRVPSDLVKAIASELDAPARAEFEERLLRSGLTLGRYNSALKYLDTSKESGFLSRIDWDANRDGERIVKPLAIERSLRAIMADLETVAKLELDDAVELFIHIWRGIREAWSTDESEFETSKIWSKAGLVACVEFVVDELNRESEEGLNVDSPDQVLVAAKALFSKVPAQFWTAEWSETGLDTAAGRGLIVQAMREARRAVSRDHPDPLSQVKALKIKRM